MFRRFFPFAAVFLSLAVAACGTNSAPRGRPPPLGEARVPPNAGVYKVGNPYQIGDTWYYPREQPDYDETGIASWYGPTFYNKPTANGELFTANDLTAAHRTLPLPVNVRVTNLDNGRSLVVRVNDRGPFAKGRIIDVSERAAELLGYKNQGTARVRVTYIGRADRAGGAILAEQTPPEIANALPAKPTPRVDTAALDIVPGATVAPPVQVAPLPAPVAPAALPDMPEPDGQITQVPVPPATRLYVQVGAFSSRDNAQRLVQRLGGDLRITTIQRNGQTLYRVRSAPIASNDEADAALSKIMSSGANDAHIVVDQ